MTVEDVWYGRSVPALVVRGVLTPLSWIYSGVMAVRNALYDRGMLRVESASIPVISVGNVTVGGTGKTPLSAYIVAMLKAAGCTPAVVMRGYGDDEKHLHARMNPGVAVVTGTDRVAGIGVAVAQGADVVVLDDAFQHRRAARDLDIVLVSAESWSDDLRVLPAGPLRESQRALRRADMIIVTRKSASDARAHEVMSAVRATNPNASAAIAALTPDSLVAVSDGERLALRELNGARILAVAGIGDPASFFAQLDQLGARVTEVRFRDHHDYTTADAARIAQLAVGHKYVVVTEKDAVKLTRVRAADGPPLWYLSQAVRLTEGDTLVASALANLSKRATSISE